MAIKKLALILLLFAFSGKAQEVIRGKIIDDKNTGIELVTVAVLNTTDSTLLQSVLTNFNGEYELSSLKKGTYLLKVFLIGYQDHFVNLEINENSKTLPEIQLKTGSVNLDEVSVAVIRKNIDYKNGNVTVNISGNPLATGNSAFDLLSKLPGVVIDENNVISIQGRTGVKLLIDDRIQQISGTALINLLRSINASNIEKIEVLKNPPVKYDAAGSAGLINIVTKKVKLVGFSGETNLNLSQGVFLNSYGGLSLNYKGKNLIFFSNINVSDEMTYHHHQFNKTVIFGNTITKFEQSMGNHEGGRFFSGITGLDWYINKKNTVGFKVDADGGRALYYNTDGNNYISDNTLGYTHLKFNSYTPNPWYSLNFNVNTEHLFDTLGSKLKYSIDYSPNYDYNEGRFENNFFDSLDHEVLQPFNYKTVNNVNCNILSSRLDLEKHFSESFSLEAGLKANSQNMNSNYNLQNKNNVTGDYTIDTNYTNAFSYNEKIMAAYINATKEVGELSLQLGLRGENTNVIAQSKTGDVKYTRNYFNLFPVFNLSYATANNHELQLSYNRRINRPGYYSFNPYKSRENIFMSSKGNPFLKPEYSNTFEVSHTYKAKLSNSFSYSLLDNYILDLTLQNDSTKETTAYVDNLKRSNTYAYSLFYQTDLKSWWNLSLNGTATYSDYSGKVLGMDYKSSGYFYSGSITNQFIILKNTKLDINARYIAPRYNGVWYHNKRWGVYCAVKQSFYNDKLQLVMALDDVFFTMIGSNQIKLPGQDWNIIATNDTRRFRLSFTYTFGKIKVEEREVSSNEEEKGRLNH